MKLTATDACNFGSLASVSISLATTIEILQFIMLVLSIVLTVGGLIAKVHAKYVNKTLTVDDLKDAKEDIDEIVSKIDKLKGDKNE